MAKRIDVSTMDGANRFLLSRGFTVNDIRSMVGTHNAKQLARMLHTSPNTVQRLKTTLGITYGGEHGLSRQHVTQKRKADAASEHRKELQRRFPKDAVIDALPDRKPTEIAHVLGITRLDLDFLMESYDLEYDDANTINARRFDDAWAKQYGCMVDELVSHGLPISLICSIMDGRRIDGGGTVQRTHGKNTVLRYLKSHHPDYHGGDYPTIERMEARRITRHVHSNHLQSVLKNYPIHVDIVKSLLGLSLLGSSYKRAMDVYGVDADRMGMNGPIWEWCLNHRMLVLTFFHTPLGSPERILLEDRVRRFRENGGADDIIGTVLSLDPASDSIRRSSDVFSACYVLLEYGFTLDDKTRSRFRQYCQSLHGAGLHDVKNEGMVGMMSQWMDDHRRSIPKDITVEYVDPWLFFTMESDVEFVHRMAEESRILCLPAILENIPFFRRYKLYYDAGYHGLKEDMRRTRENRDITAIQRFHKDDYDFVMSSLQKNGKRLSSRSIRELANRTSDLTSSDVITIINAIGIEIPRCRMSQPEEQVAGVLDSMGVHYAMNDRKLLHGMELDFYIPSLHMGIEVSPTHTHNSTYGWYGTGQYAKAPDYHQVKTRMAEQSGIDLITLYSKDLEGDTWEHVTKPFLRFKLNGPDYLVYANAVHLEPIPVKQARVFMETYHRDGFHESRCHIGFIHTESGELLGVASIGKYRYDDESLELKRLAFLPDVMVAYGLSKLVSHIPHLIEDGINYHCLYSYSRNDMGTGDGYRKAGFELVRGTAASLHWVNPLDPYDRYSWQVSTPWSAKHGVISRVIGGTDMTRREAETFMERDMPHRNDNGRGYVRVYDSGSKLWRISLL